MILESWRVVRPAFGLSADLAAPGWLGGGHGGALVAGTCIAIFVTRVAARRRRFRHAATRRALRCFLAAPGDETLTVRVVGARNQLASSFVVTGMASHGDRSPQLTPPTHAVDDPLWYWWHVCQGADVMRTFHAAQEHEAWSIVHRHPVLLLPELVEAAERAGGRSRALDGLRQMHQSLRGTAHYAPYHRLLATALVNERAGSRRTNLERALAVMKDVRAAATAPADQDADDRMEHEIRAALAALTPLPVGKPPAGHALFLDEAELAGFRRIEDRRAANPNLHDRAYTTHGGLATGHAVWLGSEASPVYRVVDARWVFSSTGTAMAYMDSPGTLQLAGDGLPSQPAIGDRAYAWGGAHTGGIVPTRRSRQCLLFRVDRVVARLDVTEGPKAAQAFQVLSESLLYPYAEAVIRRVRWVLAQYWLAIGRGAEAAQRFGEASPRTAHRLFSDYPILLLPEFPTAMASLGETHRAPAERLATLQATLKGNWQVYRDVMRALVRTLLDDTAGERRTNADAALRLVVAHRRLDSDYSWAALETECSSRAS